MRNKPETKSGLNSAHMWDEFERPHETLKTLACPGRSLKGIK